MHPNIRKEDLLKPHNMLLMYANGAFPMAESAESENIEWYLPEIRTVIPMDDFNVPRSLKKFINNSDFTYKYDFDTMYVIKKCSERSETWISRKLIEAYKNLEDLGFLHSVSVFKNSKMIGGLYGIAIGSAFFGESMYSKVPQASKCAFVKLIERLSDRGFILLDVQYQTEHLKMFGAVEIIWEKYIELLTAAISKENTFI